MYINIIYVVVCMSQVPSWSGGGLDKWAHPISVQTLCFAKVHDVEYDPLFKCTYVYVCIMNHKLSACHSDNGVGRLAGSGGSTLCIYGLEGIQLVLVVRAGPGP